MPDACLICASALPERGLAAVDRLHGGAGDYHVVTCATCGAGRTLPPATPAQLASYYPAGYGPIEATPGRAVQLVSHAIQALQGRLAGRAAPISSMAQLDPGEGLDVGCGRGDLAAWFVDRGWRMTGVEPSPGAAAQARERGVDVLDGVLATVDLEPARYDAAVFRQSLEHTEEPAGDLARVRAALKPGGIVCVSVPNFGSPQARRFRARWFHLDVPRHRTHFTPGALERALRDAGYEDVRISTSTSPVGLPGSLQYRLFGRCLFPAGLPLRVAAGLCTLALPLAIAFDRLGGGGDVLHAVARKPA